MKYNEVVSFWTERIWSAFIPTLRGKRDEQTHRQLYLEQKQARAPKG